MPKVSVIIPTYNRSKLLKQTIDSVLNQTLGDFEILVIDDGSTDNTEQVAKAFDDSRIKYFYKQNGGVSSARNWGLRKAKGRYICFLDSDDLWPKDFLQVMLEKLNQNPGYGAAYCARTVLLPDGTKKDSYQKEYCKSGYLTQDLFKKTFMQTSSICFRREKWGGFFFDESLNNAEDSDAWLRLSTKTKFLFVPQVQIIYRQRNTPSQTRHFSSRNCNRIRVLERFYFKLNGKKYVPRKVAMNKLSHAYRSAAKKAYRDNCRTAAIFLYKKAIYHAPWDFRLYWGLTKTCMINRTLDTQPDWQMPEPLPLPDNHKHS